MIQVGTTLTTRLCLDMIDLVPTENSAIKGLDDLFRKTEAKPVLYWLPLTDEQVGLSISRKEAVERLRPTLDHRTSPTQTR